MICSCKIYSGIHDTQHCMENPEQAFVDYASSYTDEAGGEWDIARDAEELESLVKNNIDYNKLPKGGDDAWHIRIELIDPDGEKFDRACQSIQTTRKLTPKENPSDILNLDHFYDS
ncbi:hypothetical protein Tco_0650659 [Tanacetum coccineum]